MQPCPCQSGEPYDNCCAPYHRSMALPPTPLALMRSRYSAYVYELDEYILGSWHPTTRPSRLWDSEKERKQWVKLQIIRAPSPSKGHENEGVVEFIAHYQKADWSRAQMRENSRFIREGNRWYYLDGEAAE